MKYVIVLDNGEDWEELGPNAELRLSSDQAFEKSAAGDVDGPPPGQAVVKLQDVVDYYVAGKLGAQR